jgi:hypothetical protein
MISSEIAENRQDTGSMLWQSCNRGVAQVWMCQSKQVHQILVSRETCALRECVFGVMTNLHHACRDCTSK